jgi:serine O-acetyltransferase
MRAPSGPGAREALRADLAWYLTGLSPIRRARRFLGTPEVWLLCSYRWGSWIERECPRGLRLPSKLLWKPLNALLSNFFDTHIMQEAQIGPGLYIGHTGGIWIAPGARLGAFCQVAQGVVIGRAGSSRTNPRAPTLGDRVWIGPHAVVTGSVRLGDGSVVGANSLVAGHVPENGVVVGVPAKVIARSGSASLIVIPPESQHLAGAVAGAGAGEPAARG